MQMLTMPETAAGQKDRQVLDGVAAAVPRLLPRKTIVLSSNVEPASFDCF